MASQRLSRVFGAVNLGSFRISAMVAGITDAGELIVLGSYHRASQGVKRGYVTDMTALNAVAMAGGYTYRARQNDLYIKRLDSNGRMVRIAAKPETKVRPGDTVEIKERYF